jgi:hypothetical protein
MTFDVETLYGLLPSIYRIRDATIADSLDDLLTSAEQATLDSLRNLLRSGLGLDPAQQRDLALLEEKRSRGPLKALLTIIAEQVAGLEENVEQLYDDQFIETCAPWVVPYIADLIGYRPLDVRAQARLGSSRAEVANTIGFRRRKGTAAVIEELAVKVTDWDAAVVEYFQRIATTQYLNHVRPDHAGSVDLRRVDKLVAIGTPFDRLAHTAEVRRIAGGKGRYNIPNVGIHLWRIGSRKLTDSPAFRVDGRRYLFSPLGANTHLFTAAERATEVTSLAGPLDVPMPIGRRALRRDLTKLYGPGLSLTVTVGGTPLDVGAVEACDLSDIESDPEASDWAHGGQDKVAIDPVLGRITFPADVAEPVLVTYYYGFPADIGGGESERDIGAAVPGQAVHAVPSGRATIGEALADAGGDGVVEITGSGRYPETPSLAAASNARLVLRAADNSRPLLQLSGDLVVSGGDSGEVIIEGLLVAGGRVLVPAAVDGQPNGLQRLRLRDCTLVPGGSLTRDGRPGPVEASIQIDAPNVTLELERCIVGGLRVVDESSAVVSHSIVDGLGPSDVAYAAPDGVATGGGLRVESSTIIGKVRVMRLEASNCIFYAELAAGDPWAAPVVAERRQVGYVRYSYVPFASHVPRVYASEPRNASGVHQVVPRFTSLRYGDPAYGQLHAACPWQIRRGAEDEGEMGVFHHLYGPQRYAGLNVRLDEYLRFGLEAGVFYAS